MEGGRGEDGTNLRRPRAGAAAAVTGWPSRRRLLSARRFGWLVEGFGSGLKGLFSISTCNKLLAVHSYGPPLSEFDGRSSGRVAETGRAVRREPVTAGMVSRGLRPGPGLSLTQAPPPRVPATDRLIFRRNSKVSELSLVKPASQILEVKLVASVGSGVPGHRTMQWACAAGTAWHDEIVAQMSRDL
jgi:hypothetical protein